MGLRRVPWLRPTPRGPASTPPEVPEWLRDRVTSRLAQGVLFQVTTMAATVVGALSRLSLAVAVAGQCTA